MITFGIIVYKNSYIKNESKNIGDYVQTLAQINQYKKIIEKLSNVKYIFDDFLKRVYRNNIDGFEFIWICRDNMSKIYDVFPKKIIYVIMNGWFINSCDKNGTIDWPPPPNIVPFFTSFHVAHPKLLDDIYVDYYKKFEPIGCRDIGTMNKFVKKGINAYFSGCLTLTIDFLKWEKKNNIIYYVDTANNTNVVDDVCVNLTHYYRTTDKSVKNIIDYTYDMLKKYSNCEKIYTSRLHGYLPCVAMGVPSVFVAPDGDVSKINWGSKDRFDGLRNIDTETFAKFRDDLNKSIINKLLPLIQTHQN